MRLVRGLVLIAATWVTVAFVHSLQTHNRSIASMALLLVVLAASTTGDRWLAVATSISAALGFSWYFVDQVGSFAIETAEGALTFSMMTLTALAGSHLAIRAQTRAEEANRRREEMERLHRLGTAMLAVGTVDAAAQSIVNKLVKLFGVHGAVLSLPDHTGSFSAGERRDLATRVESTRYTLELFGTMPSAEMCSALTNLIDLALDRARTLEQQTQMAASQRGEEFRNTVLNALAHNFRTPLTSIKAAASILRGTRHMPEDDARELATVIDEEADRLDQMIRESLDLARIESQQASPRMEPCTISEIVMLVTARVSRYLGGRRLVADVPEDLPLLFGDHFLLEQMVVQVVDNAWKYSQPGALIEMKSRVDGETLYLEVVNEGAQLQPGERSRIFAKFYRGKQTRSHVEGTGMGLAIARAIAEAHGGSLELSENPLGPAFRFVLPVSGKRRKIPPAQTEGEKRDRESQHIGG